MSLPHFFLEDQVLGKETQAEFALRLSADDAKHARVLRLNPGEHISVVDAEHDYFECEVVSFYKDELVVRIAQHLNAASRPQVVLAQGLAKGDKMDTIVRHATELGITGFVPLLCERSIVKLDEKKTKSRMKRWNTLAKSAAMQSGQPVIPEIIPPLTLDELLVRFSGATAFIVCWEEAEISQTLAQALHRALDLCGMPAKDARIVVVVGPEGGLSDSEVDMLLSRHKRSYAVSLGPTILRTETAGIVAPALVLYELEREA